jgi:hypothetical protein
MEEWTGLAVSEFRRYGLGGLVERRPRGDTAVLDGWSVSKRMEEGRVVMARCLEDDKTAMVAVLGRSTEETGEVEVDSPGEGVLLETFCVMWVSFGRAKRPATL